MLSRTICMLLNCLCLLCLLGCIPATFRRAARFLVNASRRFFRLHLLWRALSNAAATATAMRRVKDGTLSTLGLQSPATQVSFFRPNLRLSVVPKDPKEPLGQLLAILEAQPPGVCGIVYCLSREESESVAR